MTAEHWYDWQAQLQIMFGYKFENGLDWIAAGCWSILFAGLFCSVFWAVKTMNEAFSFGSFFRFCRQRFVSIWLANLLLFASVFFLPWYLLLVAFFLLPFLLTNAATAGLDDDSFGKRWSKGFKISAQSYGTSLLNLLLLGALVTLLAQSIALVFSVHNSWTNEPMMPDLLDMLTDLVKRIAMIFTDDYMVYSNIVRQAVYILFIFLVFPLLVISTVFTYYNVIEKLEAKGLKMEFEKFGKRKRNQESSFD